MNTKISEVENKIRNNSKSITTPEFKKLTAEYFGARLKQANLVKKSWFDNKLRSFNKRITANETKHLEVQKNRNSLTINYYNFFLGKNCFTSNEGSQDTFVYQQALDTLELKKTKLLIMFLVGKRRENLILNLSPYTLLLYIA